MPNHVTNRLTVIGPAESIAEFKAAILVKQKREVPEYLRKTAEGEDELKATEAKERIKAIEAEEPYDHFDFNRVIPAPAFITNGNLIGGSREEATGRNWYQWNTANWGTKWGAYDLSIQNDEPELLRIQFDTAWSTPTPIIATLGHWFRELKMTIEYFDEGHNFWGIDTKKTGDRELVENCQSDHKASDEARALWKHLCIELKGYDPEENEDE